MQREKILFGFLYCSGLWYQQLHTGRCWWFWNAASCTVTEDPWISKHVIESLKICAALYTSPCVIHLLTSRWSSSHHNRAHHPRVYFRTRCSQASAYVCVCVSLCNSLAGVSEMRWVEAVSEITLFLFFNNDFFYKEWHSKQSRAG